jgi:hypothetical protein
VLAVFQRLEYVALYGLARDAEVFGNLGVTHAFQAVEDESVPTHFGKFVENLHELAESQFSVDDGFQCRLAAGDFIDVDFIFRVPGARSIPAQGIDRQVRRCTEEIRLRVLNVCRAGVLEELQIGSLGDVLDILGMEAGDQKALQLSAILQKQLSDQFDIVPGYHDFRNFHM